MFLNLEKRDYKIKCITKVIDEQIGEITEPDKILIYEESFYKDQYSKQVNISKEQKNQASALFKDETIPKINENNKQNCDKKLTIENT